MRRLSFRSRALAPITALSLAALLGGCQQLFTTSLGTSLARTSIPIPSNLSPSQAADLAAQATANQDTKLATALVASLVAQIGTPSPATVSLESSAGSAAIVASGAGSSLTNLITTLNGSGTPSSATLISLLATVQAGVTSNVVTALSFLADPAVSGAPASSGLKATDYAIAAIVIAASVLTPGTDPSSGAAATQINASPEHATISALIASANALAEPGPSATLLAQLQTQFSI
ncbi:MAG: hypothetical protein ABSF43_01235 [Rectinemataceae bacterium]